MKPGKTGFARIKDAMGYSIKGLVFTWKNEAAFRQECVIAVILIPLAFFIAPSIEQVILLTLPVFLLLIVELINSAIEAAIDRFGDEQHVLSGAAKDIGSAAVFVSLVFLSFTWAVMLLDIFFL